MFKRQRKLIILVISIAALALIVAGWLVEPEPTPPPPPMAELKPSVDPP